MPTAVPQATDEHIENNTGVAKTLVNGDADEGRHGLQYTTTSYPSNCLHFLHKGRNGGLGGVENPAKATCKLNILIVGAGLGGLATAVALRRRGHDVTVFEQATELLEVGAGIQIPPNSGKLLKRWGVMDHLERQAVQPERINFRRWQSGEVIGTTDLSVQFSSQFGAPYHVVHRAHLHAALFARATEIGVDTRLNSRVGEYGADFGSVTMSDGSVFQGDLVIAADGVRSLARSLVSSSCRGVPRPTGYAAYRATVDVTKMKEIPELSWILEKPGLNVWIGENRHVMTYTIAAGQSFNMVLSHRDRSDPASWSQKDVLDDMRGEFEGWDPQLTKVIRLIDKAVKWPLYGGEALDKWIAPSSKLLILGDAAHAMVPYMSQGAAMAVEDGAALGVALSRIRSPLELKFALGVFERERVRRTGQMQEASMVNAMLWHFKDGPEQEARDAAMRPEVEGRHFLNSPNQWSDPVTQWWAYGYDAEAAIEECWDSAVHRLMQQC